MKVLIIGGTGVLSGAVSAELLRRGFDVTMINRGNRTVPSGALLIKSDCRNYDYLRTCLCGKEFDAVMDFLCYSKSELKDSVEFYSVYANQFFFISSTAVTDLRVGSAVYDEASPKVMPFWDYSRSKWEAEQYLVSAFDGLDRHYTIVRPAITYDDTRIPYGLAPHYGYHWTFVERARAGKPVLSWNGGMNRCNMMRVEDFASGVAGLVGNEAAYDDVFNVCGDEAPHFGDVMRCVSEITGVKIPVIDVPLDFLSSVYRSKGGEILSRGYDSVNSNAKLKRVVPDFRQTITLEDGIARTVEAYVQSEFQRGIDWEYDAKSDLVVRRWCEMGNGEKSDLNPGFVDYLGNATLRKKLYYFSIYRQDMLPVRLFNRLKERIR